MKILVDKMPKNCQECQYHAPALMMSPLGVQKEVSLCTIQATLIPPTSPDQEPNVLDFNLSPEENECPFTDAEGSSSTSKLIMGV